VLLNKPSYKHLFLGGVQIRSEIKILDQKIFIFMLDFSGFVTV